MSEVTEAPAPLAAAPVEHAAREVERRESMSSIRKRIAAHLLEAKRNAAMLITFNEIDMSRDMELRKPYKEPFQKRY